MEARGRWRGWRPTPEAEGRHGGHGEERPHGHDEEGPRFRPGGRPGWWRGRGGPEGGPPFGDFRGRHFGRGPRVGRGDVRTALLSLLAEQPRHGYQLIQEIGERSGGVWHPSPGSVYPALALLEDEGLIRAEEQESRRVFQLTDAGRAHVEAHRAELANVWNTVSQSVDGGLRELRELYEQVGAATMQVARAGSTAEVAEARKLLATTRRQLYRILADAAPADSTAGEGSAEH